MPTDVLIEIVGTEYAGPVSWILDLLTMQLLVCQTLLQISPLNLKMVWLSRLIVSCFATQAVLHLVPGLKTGDFIVMARYGRLGKR